ncbi:MAG: hypothetical protein IJN63_06950 [Clostridia bacterium]|nr:hypothetical protein [Clostridia bacterium]
MDNKEKDAFSYTYSAKQREEIESIRRKYSPTEENKLERLRRLDASVTKAATSRAVTVGVAGALIMGAGMSLAMTDIGSALGLGNGSMIVGIVVGVIGIALVSAAYGVYVRTVKRMRKRIAPEILRLSEELMN